MLGVNFYLCWMSSSIVVVCSILLRFFRGLLSSYDYRSVSDTSRVAVECSSQIVEGISSLVVMCTGTLSRCDIYEPAL